MTSFEYLWEAMQRQQKWKRLKEQYGVKQWRYIDPLSKMVVSILEDEVLHPHLPDIILDYADDTIDDTIPRLFDCAVTNAINWGLATLKPLDWLWAYSTEGLKLVQVSLVEYDSGDFKFYYTDARLTRRLRKDHVFHNSDTVVSCPSLPKCLCFHDGFVLNCDDSRSVYDVYYRDNVILFVT
jgi:hypothetical protein